MFDPDVGPPNSASFQVVPTFQPPSDYSNTFQYELDLQMTENQLRTDPFLATPYVPPQLSINPQVISPLSSDPLSPFMDVEASDVLLRHPTPSTSGTCFAPPQAASSEGQSVETEIANFPSPPTSSTQNESLGPNQPQFEVPGSSSATSASDQLEQATTSLLPAPATIVPISFQLVSQDATLPPSLPTTLSPPTPTLTASKSNEIILPPSHLQATDPRTRHPFYVSRRRDSSSSSAPTSTESSRAIEQRTSSSTRLMLPNPISQPTSTCSQSLQESAPRLGLGLPLTSPLSRPSPTPDASKSSVPSSTPLPQAASTSPASPRSSTSVPPKPNSTPFKSRLPPRPTVSHRQNPSFKPPPLPSRNTTPSRVPSASINNAPARRTLPRSSPYIRDDSTVAGPAPRAPSPSPAPSDASATRASRNAIGPLVEPKPAKRKRTAADSGSDFSSEEEGEVQESDGSDTEGRPQQRWRIGEAVMADWDRYGPWPSVILNPNSRNAWWWGCVTGEQESHSYLAKALPAGGEWAFFPPSSITPLVPITADAPRTWKNGKPAEGVDLLLWQQGLRLAHDSIELEEWLKTDTRFDLKVKSEDVDARQKRTKREKLDKRAKQEEKEYEDLRVVVERSREDSRKRRKWYRSVGE
ncbi:hypothetical protein P7C70_g1578, partial [Phenoliferia sp. Uapishka_3]